jgi:hypothetical protein
MSGKKHDGRTATSPRNGAGGGAPLKNYVQYAREFLQDSQLSVLEWGARFYVYDADAGAYRIWDPRRLTTMVKSWMIEKHPERYSKNAVSESVSALGVAQRGVVPQPPAFLDSEKDASQFIAFRNGLLDIAAASIPLRLERREATRPMVFKRVKSPNFFSTNTRPFQYDPAATCPMWERYLEILDDESREMMQLWFGYNISRNRSLPVFVVFVGEPGTGKSVALCVLRALMENRRELSFGPDGEARDDLMDLTSVLAPTVTNLTIGDFGDKFRSGSLTRADSNISDEALPSRVADGFEESLKNVSGGSDARWTDEEKHGSIRGNLKVRVACTFNANKLPVWKDESGALWRRMRVIPFDVLVRGTAQDDDKLARKIISSEMPGVLNWSIEGARKLARMLDKRQPFPQSQAGQSRVDAVRRRRDPMELFIDEFYGVKNGAITMLDDLFAAYVRYADEHDLDDPEEFDTITNERERAKLMRVRLSRTARRVKDGVDTGRNHAGRYLKNLAPIAECTIGHVATKQDSEAVRPSPDDAPNPGESVTT